MEATALRYLSAPDSNVFLAELELYDEQDNLVEGEIIGTDGSWYAMAVTNIKCLTMIC